MDPFALTPAALHEPWRLWTAHLAHFGWAHALPNLVAFAVPLVLAPRWLRPSLLGALVLVAPLLSLLLLPGLEGGQYCGASGLACALWAMVGLNLSVRSTTAPLGLMMVGGLLVKLGAETALGSCFLARADSWQALPAAHLWGSALGLGAGLLIRPGSRRARRSEAPTGA